MQYTPYPTDTAATLELDVNLAFKCIFIVNAFLINKNIKVVDID